MNSEYDHIGEVEYYYKTIGDYKKELPEVPAIVVADPKSDLSFDYSLVINRPVLDVYEILTNFNYRLLWNGAVDGFEFDEKVLNQTGAKHTCVIDGKNINFTSISKTSKQDQWIYGEQTQDVPLMKKANTFFILTENGDTTNLDIEVHLEKKNFLSQLFFPIFKKKLKANLVESTKKLKELAENNTLKELDDLQRS